MGAVAIVGTIQRGQGPFVSPTSRVFAKMVSPRFRPAINFGQEVLRGCVVSSLMPTWSIQIVRPSREQRRVVNRAIYLRHPNGYYHFLSFSRFLYGSLNREARFVLPPMLRGRCLLFLLRTFLLLRGRQC